ncbi:MAG TPA: hypothetical protein VFQ13_20580 [Anaerolineales bacterium]|nr:hypothetical protein [Anaerolineales bacterium]
MKKRYLYALLFGIPSFFVSGIVALLVFGGLMGILWLFVFGDDPWPVSPDGGLSIILVGTFLALWIASIIAGYTVGKRLENDPALNWIHILISGGLTFLLILFIVLQQLSVGNLGPKSEGTLCHEFCTQKGYSASGTPPRDSGDRSCICLDDLGNEALKVPLDSLAPEAQK